MFHSENLILHKGSKSQPKSSVATRLIGAKGPLKGLYVTTTRSNRWFFWNPKELFGSNFDG